MTALAVAICFCVVSVLLWRQGELERRRIWQRMTELDGDKRALTESLCRAQGKPYFRPAHEKVELMPAEGWYDAPERAVVPEDEE